MKKKELTEAEVRSRIQRAIDADMEAEREAYEEGFNFSSIPDIDKIACKDCKYRLKDDEDGAINSMCEKYEWMKPDAVLWDNKPCKYYKKG